MPRSLRIEYPGAVYHVLNRGNYRHAIFDGDDRKLAFEEMLSQTCERTGWIVHAFALLDNHYHICLETPDANLSAGMQWLQSSFANYFNRSVREQGHVFQGRYKSLVVERDAYLGPLLNYIHLNPLRASLEDAESLGTWRWSSLWYLFHKRKRWPTMDLSPCLYYAGGLTDTPAGRKNYCEYLAWLSTSNKAKKEQAFARMCRGWALGTREFKKDLMTEDRAEGAERLGHVSQEARELYWERLLEQMLTFHGKTQSDIDRERKSAEWKVMIAHYLKRHTAVTNGWLSRHLNMGITTGVSRYIALFESEGKHKVRAYKRMIARIIP
ncbi:transposase [Planctomycetota bacterium]